MVIWIYLILVSNNISGILQLFSGIYTVQIYNYGSRSLNCYGGGNILIQSATYGSSRYNCYLPIAETTAQVQQSCSSQYCLLRATDSFFRDRNPCPDIPRYDYSKMLNVTYTCTMSKLFRVQKSNSEYQCWINSSINTWLLLHKWGFSWQLTLFLANNLWKFSFSVNPIVPDVH